MHSSNTHVVADHGDHYLYRQNAELVAEVIGHLVQRVPERDGQSGSAQGPGRCVLVWPVREACRASARHVGRAACVRSALATSTTANHF